MRCSTRDVTPAMVLPPWRSRSSWVLSVLLIDSISCRNGLKYRCPGREFLTRAGRPQQLHLGVGECSFECLPVVVLVRHQLLLLVGDHEIRVRVQHAESEPRVRRPWRRPARTPPGDPTACTPGAAQPPKEARMRSAVAVLGPPGQSDRFAVSRERPHSTRGRVHHPHVVGRPRTAPDQMRQHGAQHPGRCPDTLVIARLPWQIRKHPTKVAIGVTQPPRLRRKAEQRL